MISIDYQSRLPLYEQIVRRFQTLILKGVLPADSQMPSVRSLAVELSINPNTIQKAYSILEQEGYIYPIKGRGNYVADSRGLLRQKKEALFSDIKKYIRYGRDLGIKRAEFITLIDELYPRLQKEDDYD